MTKRLFVLTSVLVFIQIGGLSLIANAENIAGWDSHFLGYGEWTESTNWTCNSQPLPAPGYPDTNWNADVFGETILVASQDVTVMSLQLDDFASLIITNGRSFTTQRSIYNNGIMGNVLIQNGTCNVLDALTNRIDMLSFTIGTDVSTGHLDFGSTWDSSSGGTTSCGDWHGLIVNLIKGGFRVDSTNISMYEGCTITNAGQELTFRGNWLNPDGSTRLVLTGYFTNSVNIGSNLDFSGCFLKIPVNSGSNPYICAGNNVILSNTTLGISRDSSCTNIISGRDLVQVPASATLNTNGVTVVADPRHGLTSSLSIDTSRANYKYLVLSVSGFWPEIAITNITSDSIFNSGSNILICADAKTYSGNISSVDFFNGTSLIGSCSNPPYSVTWSNVLGGAYVVKAVVHDDQGHAGESDPVNVGVQGRAADGRNVFITGELIIRHDAACGQ